MEASKSEEKIYYVSSKSRITAILLCCLGFLGLGGFHRLYVKKWMTGLLYLMTFGLFFLGTAYDLHQLIVERFKNPDNSSAAHRAHRLPPGNSHRDNPS